ncbi:MAG: hypothetical protein M1820_002884 [Bogoriella megaspora]|nr:MAG: hypothetical protein M1820_002884 [Bogoriella megaspora]
MITNETGTTATRNSIPENLRNPSSFPLKEVEDDLERGNAEEEFDDNDTTTKETNGAALDNNDLARTKSSVSIADTMSLPHEILFVAIICLAQFMTQAGLGQCLAILHIIGASFSLTNPGSLSWLIAGYSLTVGTFILFSGRLGDVFGYKRLLIIGFSWFSLWSLVAGLSIYSNHVLFVFARVLQGIGPAIVLPNGLAILGATYAPGRRKDMVFALFGACAPGGALVGGVFAALFALTWWPWAFFSFAIALAVTAMVSVWVIPEGPRKPDHAKKSLGEKIKDLDLPGAVTGITALVLFNFAWNQAPIVGWQKAYIIVTLILGVAFFGLFFYIELNVARAPLIPFGILSADVAFVLACVALGWSCFGIWVYYSYQYMQVLRGISPLLSMAWASPLAISGAAAAVTTGFLLSKLRPAWVMTLAMTFFLTGVILIATDPVDQIYWGQTFFCFIVTCWGMDMSFPAATIILSNSVSRKGAQGLSASLVTTIVNYSISLGLGFAGTVEVNQNNGGITRADILKGYRAALYMGVGLAGGGLIVSTIFLLRSYILDRQKRREL